MRAQCAAQKKGKKKPLQMHHGHSHGGKKCKCEHKRGGRGVLVQQLLCGMVCVAFLFALWKYGKAIDEYLDPPKVQRRTFARIREECIFGGAGAGCVLGPLKGHTRPVSSVSFSGDGSRILTRFLGTFSGAGD